MSLYLDASVLVALLTNDPHTDRATALLQGRRVVLVVSDFAAAEFASSIGRRVRMGELTADQARVAFMTLDTWISRSALAMETTPSDIRESTALLRRLDLGLRTPDAVNLAIARRADADLATFDVRLAASARAVGTTVVGVEVRS